MVPNLVGHGRAAQVERDAGGDPDNATYTVTDYVDDMPTDYKQYTELSHEMIDIVRKYKDANPEHEIAIAGISLGGAVTTYMAMEAPELWDRVLLTNPFPGRPHWAWTRLWFLNPGQADSPRVASVQEDSSERQGFMG